MKQLKKIQDISCEDKIVFLRADLNVPVQDGKVTDGTRITAIQTTIEHLLDQKNCKVILASHFGRPKGKVDSTYSLKFLLPVLKQDFDHDVAFLNQFDHSHPVTKSQILSSPSSLFLLENLRYSEGEESNDETYAQSLASLADIYVNDAFSASHRAHASIVGITKFLPSYAGFLMQQEVEALDLALENPTRPVAALVGGSKISTKLDLLFNLIDKTQYIILGGGMANTFLLAQGHRVGASLKEQDMIPQAQEIMKKAQEKGCQIILPTDAQTASKLEQNPPVDVVAIDQIQDQNMILDIGPQSINAIKDVIKKSKTLLWNGPVGAFEFSPFEKGTMDLAHFIANQTKKSELVSIAGGGDTVSSLNMAGCSADLTYVSCAGGAFLERCEGKILPGVEALF